jgi:prepilin-type N-terminal cleavage/methylation domain-containing protein/prepilin-type processing-associated H-X9-DG protein
MSFALPAAFTSLGRRLIAAQRGRELVMGKTRRSAFTLVELLVVIGIIAVLISILLPALSRARESANTVQCASNMRQMGLAMRMYSNEHNGCVPPGDMGAGPEYGTMSGGQNPTMCFWSFMDLIWIKGYVKGPARMSGDPAASAPGLLPGTFEVNYPTAEAGIFKCPSENRTFGGNVIGEMALHYRLNVEACPTQVNGSPSIARQQNPAYPPFYGYFRVPQWAKWSYLKPGKILVAETYAGGTADAMVYYPSKPDTANPPLVIPFQITIRHGNTKTINKDKVNGGNYLFADGHVEYSLEYHRAAYGSTGNQQMNENFVKWWDHGNRLPNSVY